MKELYVDRIADIMGIKSWQVENCVEMFADGDTIPFISRYRKEKTGGMDDAQVAELKHYIDVFNEMEKRKETVLKTISESGSLTEDLKKQIENCNFIFFFGFLFYYIKSDRIYNTCQYNLNYKKFRINSFCCTFK